eukprot:TRINITY_DN1456_c0_g1_i1.p1 TRINITY_DN1456_c0_g1~~TRINITY_DN1456_c0_g1_i1.p1  ORF type:complete len:779 (+),score=202.40 TRINITY_DN1456_c0_g1_i1:133-2337(+)
MPKGGSRKRPLPPPSSTAAAAASFTPPSDSPEDADAPANAEVKGKTKGGEGGSDVEDDRMDVVGVGGEGGSGSGSGSGGGSGDGEGGGGGSVKEERGGVEPPLKKRKLAMSTPIFSAESRRRSRSLRVSSAGLPRSPLAFSSSNLAPPPGSFFNDPDWKPRTELFKHVHSTFVIPEYGCSCGDSTPSPSGLSDVVCDGCYKIFHQRCLPHPLDSPPLSGDISYEFLCPTCNFRSPGTHYFIALPKSWLEVAEVALYNLYLQNQESPLPHPGIAPSSKREYFNFQTEVCDFIFPRWPMLCYGITKGRSWENSLRSCLESHPLFFSKYNSDAPDSSSSPAPPPLPEGEWWKLVSTTSPLFLDRRRIAVPGTAAATSTTSTTTSLSDPASTPTPQSLPSSGTTEGEVKKVTGVTPRELGGVTISERRAWLDEQFVSIKMALSLPSSPKKKQPRGPKKPKADSTKRSTDKRPVKKGEWADGVGDDEHYYVEKIVSKRVNPDLTIDYKIKWVGYDRRFNSWVAKEDVQAPEFIDEFEKTYVEPTPDQTTAVPIATSPSPPTPQAAPSPPPTPTATPPATAVKGTAPASSASAKKKKRKQTPKKRKKATASRRPSLQRSQDLTKKEPQAATASTTATTTAVASAPASAPLVASQGISADLSKSTGGITTETRYALSTESAFSSGDDVTRILGFNKHTDESLLACVEWNTSEKTWVPLSLLRYHYPHTLIKYFEAKLTFAQ